MGGAGRKEGMFARGPLHHGTTSLDDVNGAQREMFAQMVSFDATLCTTGFYM